jgi:polyribonucleotide nucleotidyltransferase
VLSHDLENDPDIVAMVAASAALTLSGVPFMGPIGGARVGYINGEYVLNPTDRRDGNPSSTSSSPARRRRADGRVGGQGAVRGVMLGAVMFGHRGFQPVIDAIIELAEKAAKEPATSAEADSPRLEKAMLKPIVGRDELRAAYKITAKASATPRRSRAKEEGRRRSSRKGRGADVASRSRRRLQGARGQDVVRWNILDTGKRIDGRDTKTVRPIVAEVGVLPRTHGSALFTRGETQALVVATLGTGEDEQFIDALEGTYKRELHAALQLPALLGRRDRPHGLARPPRDRPRQARLARHPPDAAGEGRVPLHDPRRLRDHRVERLVLDGDRLRHLAGADGCGVPLKRPVAGIAMGLIKEGERFAVLSDILGDEDHLGDMDFKVAGTENGITSLQMDIKIAGITEEIMKVALGQAKDGRLHILGEMAKA